MPYISVGANYNILAVLFFILGVVIFINKDKIKYYNLIQGLIIFICFFSKQNIGIYYGIAITINEIFEHKKESIHYIIREFIVAIICTFVAILIMHITGCFEGFLNYAFFGMGEFATKNLSLQDVVGVVIIGYIIIAICSYILAFLLSIQNEKLAKDLKILGIFSILLNFTILPIANLYHTSFAILLNIVIFIYIFENLLLNKLNNKIIIGISICTIYTFINIYGIICGYRASKNVKMVNNIYFSSNICYELNEKLIEVTKYMKQKEKEGIDVVCISADAPLYMTYLGKNHGKLDLCFTGNLGYGGKDDVIEELKTLNNIEILINSNDYWQEINDIKKYVKENYRLVDTIQDLNLYKK